MCGCALSRRYIDVCNCDMFSVVNVYHDHLKFCVVCINGRSYVCCGECYVVSNECDEPTSCLVQPIGAHCCEVMYFGCFVFISFFSSVNQVYWSRVYMTGCPSCINHIHGMQYQIVLNIALCPQLIVVQICVHNSYTKHQHYFTF